MKHSILCVDDEADNVDALERLFRKRYRVLKATSGEEALRILAKEPDKASLAVIISDQRMPGMSGVELLAQSIKHCPDAIRILLTGYADIESVIAAINSGQVYRYVTKPWDPVDLGNAVDKAVDRWEVGAELADKNRKLTAALDELRGLDEAKTQFMLLVNHELRTPLTSMLSFADLLGETELDQDQAKYLARVRASADRLQAIVSDTLEFVSAETGLTKVDKKARKTKSVFTSSIQTLQAEFASHLADRKLQVELSIEEAFVVCDEKSIRNVLRRLLHNALKFAEKGSAVEIQGAAASETSYRFGIRNRAADLDKRQLKLIMKPFALNENALNHTTGTGMGLSICQSLLRLQGSELELSSSRGVVEASFELPLDT